MQAAEIGRQSSGEQQTFPTSALGQNAPISLFSICPVGVMQREEWQRLRHGNHCFGFPASVEQGNSWWKEAAASAERRLVNPCSPRNVGANARIESALAAWFPFVRRDGRSYLFSTCRRTSQRLLTRQYARCGTHSLRRTKAALICKKTGKLACGPDSAWAHQARGVSEWKWTTLAGLPSRSSYDR
jgi:hypothetical protein